MSMVYVSTYVDLSMYIGRISIDGRNRQMTYVGGEAVLAMPIAAVQNSGQEHLIGSPSGIFGRRDGELATALSSTSGGSFRLRAAPLVRKLRVAFISLALMQLAASIITTKISFWYLGARNELDSWGGVTWSSLSLTCIAVGAFIVSTWWSWLPLRPPEHIRRAQQRADEARRRQQQQSGGDSTALDGDDDDIDTTPRDQSHDDRVLSSNAQSAHSYDDRTASHGGTSLASPPSIHTTSVLLSSPPSTTTSTKGSSNKQPSHGGRGNGAVGSSVTVSGHVNDRSQRSTSDHYGSMAFSPTDSAHPKIIF
jgi:hypothetical protein